MIGDIPLLDDEALWAYAEAAAAAVGLDIPAERRPGVLANLRTLREHAGLVMTFPLDAQTQVAPVFRP
ncbi:MAG: DUF4089 domain-containing protein [Caulobacteraceae bacterium]|nr:DUF4089 domain-containing protein [Caulobacteraceae bacterium]